MTVRAEDFIVVLVTTNGRDEANQIAAAVVGEGLAGCVSCVGPIESTYVWQEEVVREEEYLLVIKARRASFDALEKRVSGLHSYEVPEVIALPLTAGADAYLRWLGYATQPQG